MIHDTRDFPRFSHLQTITQTKFTWDIFFFVIFKTLTLCDGILYKKYLQTHINTLSKQKFEWKMSQISVVRTYVKRRERGKTHNPNAHNFSYTRNRVTEYKKFYQIFIFPHSICFEQLSRTVDFYRAVTNVSCIIKRKTVFLSFLTLIYTEKINKIIWK